MTYFECLYYFYLFSGPCYLPDACHNDCENVFCEQIEGSCVKEGTYLAWYNGEPIEQENNITQSLCEEKCDRNPDCDAWTLNTRNGWCALKRWDQVKEEENEGFVSGFKHC